MNLSDEVMALGRQPLPATTFSRAYRRGKPYTRPRQATHAATRAVRGTSWWVAWAITRALIIAAVVVAAGTVVWWALPHILNLLEAMT